MKNVARKSKMLLTLFGITLVLSSCGLDYPVVSSQTEEPVVMHVGFSSSYDINHVPALIALVKMEEEGFKTQASNFAQAELSAAAMENKQIDVSTGAIATILKAIQKGAPAVGIMATKKNDWTVMAKKDIKTCEDLDGKSTALHSEGAISTALLKAYLEENCPDIEPLYLIIPGSQNRTAALLAGEIDVTPVEIIDAMRIEDLSPGDYHRIVDFASELPDLLTSGYWVHQEFLEEHPEYVNAFIRNVLEVNRQIYNDPAWFAEQIPRYIEFSEEEIPQLPIYLETLIAMESFPKNGEYTAEKLQESIDFLQAIGRIEPGMKVEDGFVLEPLDVVLGEIGRVDENPN